MKTNVKVKIPMTLKTLGKILLLSSLAACGDNYPKVTLHQLDTVNGVVNPFKISKVDKKACAVEVEELKSFPIMGPELHGGFCLTAKEFGDYKAWLQAECKTQNETKSKLDQGPKTVDHLEDEKR